MTKYDNADLPPNRIVGATAECLIVEIDGKHRSVPWAAVNSVYASIAIRDDDMPILAFEIKEGRAVRSMLVAQVDPVWAELKAVLHIGLPEALPVEVWERALVDLPMVLPVFRRRESG